MTIVHIEGNVEVNNKREIHQINRPIKTNMTIVSQFRRIGEQKDSFLILSRDSLELLLVTPADDGYKKYDLFTSSDKALFYEGEMGVGGVEWLLLEDNLVFYKCYIVHDELKKVIVHFNDTGPIQLMETKADTDMPWFTSSNYLFF